MTNGISESTAKWLTYLVYIILTTLAISNGWLIVKQVELPDRFVRLERYSEDKKATLERYLCDIGRIEKALSAINAKLDHKIVYNIPSDGR